MKKSLIGLVASVVMCSVAVASPSTNEPSFTGLNATEQTVLFGEGSTIQVVALDDAEMKATEGKFSFKIGNFTLRFFEKYTFEVTKDTKSIFNIPSITFYSKTGSHAYSQSTQYGY